MNGNPDKYSFADLFEGRLQGDDDKQFSELFEESCQNGEIDGFEAVKRSDVDRTNTPRAPRSRPRIRPQKLDLIKVKRKHTLDLHGVRGSEARDQIRSFIEDCRSRRIRAVRIITGRGIGSENGPVLKPIAEDLLTYMKERREIVHFVLVNAGGSYIVQLYQ